MNGGSSPQPARGKVPLSPGTRRINSHQGPRRHPTRSFVVTPRRQTYVRKCAASHVGSWPTFGHLGSCRRVLRLSCTTNQVHLPLYIPDSPLRHFSLWNTRGLLVVAHPRRARPNLTRAGPQSSHSPLETGSAERSIRSWSSGENSGLIPARIWLPSKMRSVKAWFLIWHFVSLEVQQPTRFPTIDSRRRQSFSGWRTRQGSGETKKRTIRGGKAFIGKGGDASGRGERDRSERFLKKALITTRVSGTERSLSLKEGSSRQPGRYEAPSAPRFLIRRSSPRQTPCFNNGLGTRGFRHVALPMGSTALSGARAGHVRVGTWSLNFGFTSPTPNFASTSSRISPIAWGPAGRLRCALRQVSCNGRDSASVFSPRPGISPIIGRSAA